MESRDSADRTDLTLATDATENAQTAEPADPTDRIEPAEPTERIEPDDPIDKIDPTDPMLSSEFFEPIDHREPWLFVMPGILAPGPGPGNAATRAAPKPRPAWAAGRPDAVVARIRGDAGQSGRLVYSPYPLPQEARCAASPSSSRSPPQP